ncbi:hypothetical protein B0H17DRAFT_878467, partial [Mycena rosella]
RATLRKEIMSWRVWQFDRFPGLQKDFVGGDPDAPQKEKLWLPSELNEPARAVSGMQELAAIEYELRKGQAYDALADVRTAIKTFNFNVAFKIVQVQGQSANTRAQNFLRTLANDRLIAADGYRRARDALLRLGLLPTDTCLAALANEDLYAKNTRDSPKMGESGDVDPWFWTRTTDPLGTNRTVAVDRVKWFRDRAKRDRAVEQKETVEAEFGRTIKSFTQSATAWKTL